MKKIIVMVIAMFVMSLGSFAVLEASKGCCAVKACDCGMKDCLKDGKCSCGDKCTVAKDKKGACCEKECMKKGKCTCGKECEKARDGSCSCCGKDMKKCAMQGKTKECAKKAMKGCMKE
jgi:hypothetical protein